MSSSNKIGNIDNQSSLIISTYNWPEALNACLKSILKQKTFPKEIIIADDGSSQDTRLLINKMKELFPIPIYHIWHEDNGFRKTIILNKAIKKATGSYIIQIDGDVVVNRNFIEDHLIASEQGCFIRGSRAILNYKTSQFYLKYGKLTFITKLFLYFTQPAHSLRLFPFLSKYTFRKIKSGENVKGCNISFWKADIVNVNGYDNTLKGWGHEDEELCLRLVNFKVTKKIIRFSAVAFHLYHKFLSRADEKYHTNLLEKIKSQKVIRTQNGLSEID